MNPTLARFGYPHTAIKEYEHWVVLLRPLQTTPLSCIIAARAPVDSLGGLSPQAGAELPQLIRSFEATVRRLAPAVKFNYLALMMVDPNPHLHAIPRYAAPVDLLVCSFCDFAFPRPPDVLSGAGLNAD